MQIEIATLFPEMCEAVLSESIIGRARAKGAITVNCHQIRAYTKDKHNRVDDSPFGGGMGMVMQAQPIYDCWQAVRAQSELPMHTIYLSPKGNVLTQQRVIDRIVDEEISIGDYVVTGGELPALGLTDAVARMCENVLPAPDAYEEESHYNGLLEYPQYTRPEIWEGEGVPQVLLSGHHKNIAQWRAEQSLEITRNRRPDLWSKWLKEHC